MGGRGGGSSRAASGEGAPAASAAPAAAAPVSGDLGDQIMQTFDDVKRSDHSAYGNRGYVDIQDLRAAFPNVDKATFDQELKKLNRAQKLHFEPNMTEDMITSGEKAAAFRLGGAPQHYVRKM